MPDSLTPVWRQVDRDPPGFRDEEVSNLPAPIRSWLVDRGLMLETTPARSATCRGCSGGFVGATEWLPDSRTGQQVPYLACPVCGPVALDPASLRRWVVDVPALMSATFAAAGGRGPMVETIPNRLWHLGSAVWNGRRSEVYFLRCVYAGNRAILLAPLATHSKAVLFFPTETAVLAWGGSSSNPTVALESVVGLGPDGLVFDSAPIEGRLADAGSNGAATSQKKPHPKRAIRTERIDRLTKEMVKHLLAARDHAFAMQEISKVAKLLPRPSKKQLGERLGLSKSAVTRCFTDPAARELNLYWEVALDLGRVMGFHGPAGGSQTT